MRVTGQIVQIESRPWTMEGRSGVITTAKVHEARASIVDVVVPEGFPTPREDDLVDWLVTVEPRNSRVRVSVVSEYAGFTTHGGADFPAQARGGRSLVEAGELAGV